jgi:capsular polysaccharide biosynthesis protein
MLKALRRHWALALLTAVLSMAAVVTVLAIVPRTYTATAVVALSPRPEARFSGDLLRLTIPSYISVAESPSVAADLGRRHDLEPEQVRAGISVENPPGSNTLLLSVTWSEPDVAADLANGLADVVVDESATDTLLSGSVAAAAIPPREPTWPPLVLSLFLGGLLAVLLGIAAAWLVDRRRSMVTSSRDVVALVEAEALPAPVLTIGTSSSGAAEFVARAVAAEVRGGSSDPAEVEFVLVGPAPARTLGLAVGTAAALSREGMSVCVRLRAADRSLARDARVDEELRFAGPGKVTWNFTDLSPAGGPAEDTGDSADGPDVVVRISDGVERLRDLATGKALVGVVPVVASEVRDEQVRGVVKALHEMGAPVLAVCYLLRRTEGRSSADS